MSCRQSSAYSTTTLSGCELLELLTETALPVTGGPEWSAGVGDIDTGVGDIGACMVEVGMVEVGMVEVGMVEVGMVEVGMVEVGMVEVGMVEVGMVVCVLGSGTSRGVVVCVGAGGRVG